MTTPTDPTTLRTALEALLEAAKAFRGRRPVDWNDPTEKPLTDALIAAHALLATPAPAADEARAGTCIVCGLHRTLCTYYDRHPFQPAPTPAPPTPPATERCQRMTLSGARCGRPPEHIAHRPQFSRYDHDYLPTPPATGPVSVGTMTDDEGRAFIEAAKGPATEPVAALVERLLEDLLDEAHLTGLDLARRLDAIVAAARAEGLDGAWAEVERALPEGWWLHSIYQRYFGDEVGYAATAHGGAGLGLQGNGPTPVEALRSLATNLREHPDDR